MLQAVPYLEAAGITLDIQPLFDDRYLQQFVVKGTRNRAAMIAAYVRRLVSLTRARDYDFIWVQYELFPYLPGMFERLVSLIGKPVIYDIDDAIFHQYDQHPNRLIRAVLGSKLQPMMRASTVAFCGNEYLRAYVQQFCSRTEIIPTTVDMTRYLPVEKPAGAKPTLGWIGSPSTWRYCLPHVGMISELVQQDKLSMLVVGAGHAADTTPPFTFKEWDEANEIADVQAMDIGIMPVPEEPWARGKCGYKLIQYMACGLPVIASPVGVNTEIVHHGVNGFLASTAQEWRDAITQLVEDPALRHRMGQAGRARVDGQYSIQRYGPRMAQLIQSI